MQAEAEVRTPSNKPDSQNGADLVSVTEGIIFHSSGVSQTLYSEKDSWVYHPDVEGRLTMPLLKEIADRKWYKLMGFNPLIVASFVGEPFLVHQLLEEGMDPRTTDTNGRSALWWAEKGWESDVIVSIASRFPMAALPNLKFVCSSLAYFQNG